VFEQGHSDTFRPAAPRRTVRPPAPPGAARRPRPHLPRPQTSRGGHARQGTAGVPAARAASRGRRTPGLSLLPALPDVVLAPARGCLPSVPPCSKSKSLLYKAPEPLCPPRVPTSSTARRDRRPAFGAPTASSWVQLVPPPPDGPNLVPRILNTSLCRVWFRPRRPFTGARAPGGRRLAVPRCAPVGRSSPPTKPTNRSPVSSQSSSSPPLAYPAAGLAGFWPEPPPASPGDPIASSPFFPGSFS
jgi:hypothetical protein